MEAIIKKITDKTGVSEQQATAAIHEVVTFLKTKLPPGLGEQVDAAVGSSKREALSVISDKSKKIEPQSAGERVESVFGKAKQDVIDRSPGFGRDGITDFIEY
jgi:hypothetical protein